MSGEPKTLTPEQEKAAREAFETRYKAFAWWTERFGTQHPALRKDENGDYLEEGQRKYWTGFQEGYAAALGVPVVARDEANELTARLAECYRETGVAYHPDTPDRELAVRAVEEVRQLRLREQEAHGTVSELRAALDAARDAMVSALAYHHHSLSNPVKEELNAAINRAGRALAGGES